MSADATRLVYLDHVASSPVDRRVAETICTVIKNNFGNPLNVHTPGQAAQEIIETARQNVAALINADPKEIIFTSCGTESNNFALYGLAQAAVGKGKHIITSQLEHFSILHALKNLEQQGFEVTYLPVDKFGFVSPEQVASAIRNDTILVSLTHASNEIGTIEPIAEIGKKAKEKGVLFHVDAVQCAGIIPVDVKTLGVDALTLASNTFYGPTGVAALYLKKGTRILPYLVGGTQEEGRRAGTHNLAGIAGMGEAAKIAKAEMAGNSEKLIKLRDKLAQGLVQKIPEFFLTGHPTGRLPGHVSGVVKYIEGESMSMLLDMEGIAVSTGSACVSKALKASHVVLAIGVSPEDAHGSLVFSMGKDNTDADVDHVLEKLPPIVERLRQMSPLYKK
ncbi:MAG: cysteine desulfurase family protein [Candidatus Margulisiibacteriota bacterium]